MSGIQRIVYNGAATMDVQNVSLTNNGFDLTFTQPLDASASDVKNYRIKSYRYEYKKKDINEGIDVANQFDVQDEDVTASKISEDRKKVSLAIKNLKAGEPKPEAYARSLPSDESCNTHPR